MPRFHNVRLMLLTNIMIAVATASTAPAASSTSRGQVSVTQVRAMLDQARTNATARQTLTAYLAGIGETAGLLRDATRADTASALTSCTQALVLSDDTVRRALETGAPDPQLWGETAATPLIARDMLQRAGCKIKYQN